MRGLLVSMLATAAVACGGPPKDAETPSVNAQDAKRQAERGEGFAPPESGDRSAPPVLACGDTVLNDQVHSGTEQLTHTVGCVPIHADPPANQQRMPRAEPDPSEAVPLPPIATEPPPVPPPPKAKPTSGARARSRS